MSVGGGVGGGGVTRASVLSQQMSTDEEEDHCSSASPNTTTTTTTTSSSTAATAAGTATDGNWQEMEMEATSAADNTMMDSDESTPPLAAKTGEKVRGNLFKVRSLYY